MQKQNGPGLLALDFDGVLCDGLREYFQTAWRAYCQMWQSGASAPPSGLADRFYHLRPVVETGWEMPVLLRALQSGTADAAILAAWPAIARRIVVDEGLNIADIARLVDDTRDRWIQTDLSAWLAQHQFFPGTIDWLKTLERDGVLWAIVTTKEGRFVRKLLDDCGIHLADDRLFGKEVRRPKSETLEQLQEDTGVRGDRLWFVEDRLPALQAAAERPALAGMRLFLAEWGYTTATHRHAAARSDRIQLLSLATCVGDFAGWLSEVHNRD
ncbi:MAG: HAD family hydrolase [Cyanobacteria bacterium P01_D01_bin.123]